MKLLVFIFLCIPLFAYSQKQSNIWYFGNKAGLDFNSGVPIPLINSSMSTIEGCSTMADSNGQLLFYSDGVTIWNKNHDTMDNGHGLFGSVSSAQSALIVKQPGNNNIYYIFTTDIRVMAGFPNKGLNYSVVDIDANGGLGSVILKNQHLMDGSNEKVTAVHHSNRNDVWIASAKGLTDSVYLFLLDNTGLSIKNSIVNKGKFVYSSFPSQMKFSTDGRYLAYGNGANLVDSGKIFLIEFDNSNGSMINSKTITLIESCPYGIEFSPNSEFLYFTNFLSDYVYQVKISSIVSNVRYSNYSRLLNFSVGSNTHGSMQLAPNSRIYIACNNDTFLNVIEQPDSFNCLYKNDNLYLAGRVSSFGLPSIVQSSILNSNQFKIDTFCIGDSVVFDIKYSDVDSVQWDFGDGSGFSKSDSTVVYFYKDSGNFEVNAKVFARDGSIRNYSNRVRIEYISRLKFSDTILCKGDSLLINPIDPSIQSYQWENGQVIPSRLLKLEGIYWLNVGNKYCSKRDTFKLHYGDKPKVFIGNDTVFCDKFKHVLDAGKSFKSYIWNTGQNTYQIEVNEKGSYDVRVIDSNACFAADTVSLGQIERPVLEMNMDTVNCQYVFLSTTRRTGVEYLWSNGDTGTVTKVDSKGLYFLQTKNSICEFTDTLNVTLLPKPDVYLGPDTAICRPVVLSTFQTGEYLWNDGSKGPSIIASLPGIYWVMISRNRCTTIDTIVLSECIEPSYFLPNVFSPNGDQINDVFKVLGNNIDKVEMLIFNRWGEQISKGEEWDGNYKNALCMQGAYLYYVVIRDVYGKKHYLKGVVNLIY